MSDDKKEKLAKIEGEDLDRPNEGRNKTATDELDGKTMRGRPKDMDGPTQ